MTEPGSPPPDVQSSADGFLTFNQVEAVGFVGHVDPDHCITRFTLITAERVGPEKVAAHILRCQADTYLAPHMPADGHADMELDDHPTHAWLDQKVVDSLARRSWVKIRGVLGSEGVICVREIQEVHGPNTSAGRDIRADDWETLEQVMESEEHTIAAHRLFFGRGFETYQSGSQHAK